MALGKNNGGGVALTVWHNGRLDEPSGLSWGLRQARDRCRALIHHERHSPQQPAECSAPAEVNINNPRM